MTNYTTCPGLNGRTYQLELYTIGTAFKQVPGVYVFLKGSSNGNWDALYVGETDNLDERLNAALKHHHMWPTCAMQGATHVAVIIVQGGKIARCALETELRHSLNPPCNQQAA